MQVLKNINFQINEGRFVGFIGPNGAGKTTTIKCMMQFIFPDKGDVTFFEQKDLIQAKKRIGFLPERPYFQEFLTATEFLKLHWDLSGLKKADFQKRADEVLERVKLSHAKHKKLRDYSKGMLQRIGIAQALLANPDFLILDEPTNDLDILTLQVLEDFLMDFKGCLVIVSHDRYFLDKLTEHLFVFEGEGKVRDFLGNYNEYRIRLKEEQRLAIKEEKNSQRVDTKPTTEQKRKLTFKEQTEFKQLEKDIEILNQEKSALTHKLSGAETSHLDIQKIAKRIEEIILSLDEKEMRWLQLSEYA